MTENHGDETVSLQMKFRIVQSHVYLLGIFPVCTEMSVLGTVRHKIRKGTMFHRVQLHRWYMTKPSLFWSLNREYNVFIKVSTPGQM